MTDRKFLTPQQIAKMVGVSGEAIRKALRSGELKGYNLGRWKVEEKDFLEWFEGKSNQNKKDA